MMQVPGDFPLWLINKGADTGQGGIDALFDEHNLIAGQRSKVAGEVPVLAGKVLMDVKDMHRCFDKARHIPSIGR